MRWRFGPASSVKKTGIFVSLLNCKRISIAFSVFGKRRMYGEGDVNIIACRDKASDSRIDPKS